MTLSVEAATDPNSNTVTLSTGNPGRGTSTAPCIPGTSDRWVGSGLFWLGALDAGEEGASLLPLHQRNPMAYAGLGMRFTQRERDRSRVYAFVLGLY